MIVTYACKTSFYANTLNVHVIKHTFPSVTYAHTQKQAFEGGDTPTEISYEAVNETDFPQS